MLHQYQYRLHALKEAIRRPYCWPGGYTIALYLRDNERICNRCAREEWREIVYDSINGYGTCQAGYTDIYWECITVAFSVPGVSGMSHDYLRRVPSQPRREVCCARLAILLPAGFSTSLENPRFCLKSMSTRRLNADFFIITPRFQNGSHCRLQ